MRKHLDAFARLMGDYGLSEIYSKGVEQARAFFFIAIMPDVALPSVYQVEDRSIPGPGGEIPIRIFRPNAQKDLAVLMWFHGGGWVLGNVDGCELNCRKLANEAGCVVVAVDYRLAPETTFPGAIDDCSTATAWVASSAVELGIDPRRIAVGGDSAGGNLAACVAYRAREQGPRLAFQLLVYPVIDADFDRPSYLDNGQGYVLTRNAMRWYWDCYVPDLSQRRNPSVSPIHATDLSGLAAALVITAEYDPLRDEGEAYGAALHSAGVPAETRRYNGMIHGFFNMITDQPVDEIQAALRDAAASLKKAFNI